jgi:hypothetical protein
MKKRPSTQKVPPAREMLHVRGQPLRAMPVPVSSEPEVLVSKQIDYELDQYDEYMEGAQHLVESGSVAEAGAFVALANLCYEK